MTQPLTPAEIRLAQYGQRTSTWSTATYNDGTEKALHEIALGLKAEVDRLRAELATANARLDATARLAGRQETKLRELGTPATVDAMDVTCESAAEETHVVADDSNNPERVDDCPGCEPVGSESSR